MVKPDVKKGDEVHFLARCHVNAEMNKKRVPFLCWEILPMQYAVSLGTGGCCKHEAATVYHFSITLNLDLQMYQIIKPAPRSYKKWHVPGKNTTQKPCFLRT